MSIGYCERRVVVTGAEGLLILWKILAHHFGEERPIERRIVGFTQFDAQKTDEPNLYVVRVRALGEHADRLAAITAPRGDIFEHVNKGLDAEHPAYQSFDA